MLHTLNVYENPEKEHTVVDHSVVDAISISEIRFLKYLEYGSLILQNYKKLKVTFIISSFLSAQYVLVTTAE